MQMLTWFSESSVIASDGSPEPVKVSAVKETEHPASIQRFVLAAFLPVAGICMSGDPGVEVGVFTPSFSFFNFQLHIEYVCGVKFTF